VDSREVAARYYEALGRNDLDGVISTLDPACHTDVPGATFEDREGVRAWMKAFFDAFPDIQHSIGELDVDGSRVGADVHVVATHTAPMATAQGTIPATGRPIEITARNEMRIEGDAIAELRIEFDAARFMGQLGVG
jgi:predicted ester cyclase